MFSSAKNSPTGIGNFRNFLGGSVGVNEKWEKVLWRI